MSETPAGRSNNNNNSSYREVRETSTYTTHVSPRKIAADDRDPLEISMGALSHSVQGRQTSYETRLTMQRELDDLRNRLRQAERNVSDLRRQNVGYEEELVQQKAVANRAEEELRSCKGRLTSAAEAHKRLTEQYDEVCEKLHELQLKSSRMYEELKEKTSLAGFLQQHNAEIELRLSQYRQETMNNQRILEGKIAALTEENAALKARLAGANSENDTLRGIQDTLKTQLGHRESELRDREAELSQLDKDVALVRDELQSNIARVAAAQQDYENLRQRFISKEEQFDVLQQSVSASQDQLVKKDAIILSLQSEVARLDAELLSYKRKSERSERLLEAKSEAYKTRERALTADLKTLHSYVSKRENDIFSLADQLQRSGTSSHSYGGGLGGETTVKITETTRIDRSTNDNSFSAGRPLNDSSSFGGRSVIERTHYDSSFTGRPSAEHLEMISRQKARHELSTSLSNSFH